MVCMSNGPNVVVLTHYLSPYQAELFNAIGTTGELSLRVYYLHRLHPTRN